MKRPDSTSLRRGLLVLLLPMLAGITALELWMTDRDASDAANSAYDRSLLGAVKSIASNISTASGGLSVELPYRMFEFFELTANGQVYFRVASKDGLVEIGSADLPPPPTALLPDTPVFYDAVYFGEAVRLAAYSTTLNDKLGPTLGRTVMIQVAESVRSRHDFTTRFIALAAWRDALVFVLTLACVALAVTLALKPMARLAAQVRSRQPDDLTPLAEGGLPAEVAPLVMAVNQHMGRSHLLSLQQREFVDDASHQLRTHLTTLHMQVDYIAGEDDMARVKHAVAALGDEIRRSTHTTNQLLALARSDAAALQCQPFGMRSLVRDVALQCMAQARAKAIDLGVRDGEDDETAWGDAGLLREALLNLVSNAVAYTPHGGEVTVLFSWDTLGWSLAVSDNGPGLSEQERDTLGHRFRRKPGNESPGSGLGLAIARAIAGKHGGVLRLDGSEPGPGLHASLWWPRPRTGEPG